MADVKKAILKKSAQALQVDLSGEFAFTAGGYSDGMLLPFWHTLESKEQRFDRLLDEFRGARGKKRIAKARQALIDYVDDVCEDLREDLRLERSDY